MDSDERRSEIRWTQKAARGLDRTVEGHSGGGKELVARRKDLLRGTENLGGQSALAQPSAIQPLDREQLFCCDSGRNTTTARQGFAKCFPEEGIDGN